MHQKRITVAIAIAVVSVLVAAVGLYTQISQRAVSRPTSEGEVAGPSFVPGAQPGTAPRPAAPTIEVSAERLAQRLRDKDGSAEDWVLLARSYVQMRRYPDAVDAFAKALEKAPGNAAFMKEQSVARKAASEGAPAR